MPNTKARQVVLLMIAAVAAASLLVPHFGRAQEASPAAGSTADPDLIAMGEAQFNETCIACHQAGGAGARSEITFTGYPALAGDPLVTLEDPTVLVDTVLWGRGGMPSFAGWSDEELAAVLTYVRQVGDNDAGPVDPAFIAERRALRDIPPPEPATPFATPAGGDAAPTASDASGEPGTPEAIPTLGS